MFLQLFRYWNKRMLIGKFLFMQIPDNYLDNFPKILLLHLTSSNFFMWEMERYKIVILISDGVWSLKSVCLEPGNINLPASCFIKTWWNFFFIALDVSKRSQTPFNKNMLCHIVKSLQNQGWCQDFPKWRGWPKTITHQWTTLLAFGLYT